MWTSDRVRAHHRAIRATPEYQARWADYLLWYYRVTPDPRVEQWWVLDGLPRYYVSNLGRVWSSKTHALLKPRPCPANGFLLVSPWDRGRPRPIYIHHAVAAAFLGPRPPGMEVGRVDGDRLDCAVSNLYWKKP